MSTIQYIQTCISITPEMRDRLKSHQIPGKSMSDLVRMAIDNTFPLTLTNNELPINTPVMKMVENGDRDDDLKEMFSANKPGIFSKFFPHAMKEKE